MARRGSGSMRLLRFAALVKRSVAREISGGDCRREFYPVPTRRRKHGSDGAHPLEMFVARTGLSVF
ncbi:MAG: hypothetical protein Q7J47_21435 [Azoarcus sp.]|nr:hypothetical protein [Azoarcus sp.]